MESNLKKSQLSKWHFNILNNLKRFNKPKEEKEVTKEIENKLKISQSPKSHSNMINFFRKLSIRSEKNISSETTPLGEGEKESSKTKNFHLNDNSADFVAEKISKLKLNDVSTDRKKYTLQKCNNKIAVDKKDFDNSEKAFYFDKNIKVEEYEDEYGTAPNAAKSKSKYTYNDKVKSLNTSWIDGEDTKVGGNKFSNNLGTTSYNNKVKIEDSGKLLNTDSGVYCLGNKDIKIEEENELDDKSEFTPVTFKERKFNNSDFYESSSKHSKYVDYRHDYKSVSNSEDTPVEDLDIIERGPLINLQNKGTHRVNPSQRRVDQVKKVLCHSSVGSRMTVKRPTINSTLDYIPVINLNAASLRVEDCYCNFVDAFNPYVENHATPMSCSLFNQEQLYWNRGNCNAEDIAKKEAEKIIDSYVDSYRRQELEHVSSCLQCNLKINAQTEADEIIDWPIESYRQRDSKLMSLGNYDPEYCYVSEEIDKYIGIEMNKYIIKRQKDHCNTFEDVYDFSKADEVLASCDAATPESECSSSGSQFNDLSNENEEDENFCDEIKNYVNNFFQCDNLVSNSHVTALEKFCSPSKNGYYNRIASKDQQNCNSESKMPSRNKLINSAAFSKDKCRKEYLEMCKKIRAGEFGTIDKRVIHMLKPTGEKKYRRTNLHAAVMEGNLEKAFCIVEIHRQYHGHIACDINTRDNKGKKTVLDRANENKSSSANDLLIQYLAENNAKPSIHLRGAIHHVSPISTLGT